MNVTTNSSSCAWAYSTDSPAWISLSAPGASNNSVSGSAALTVTALASSLPVPRSGNIRIQGANTSANIVVNQGAAQCSMTLQPVSATLPASGGTSSFAVQTACSWAATSNTLWISVTSASASGTGNGTVTYTAAPNPCVQTQSGSIVVTSQPPDLAVTENGSPNRFVTFTRQSERAASRKQRPPERDYGRSVPLVCVFRRRFYSYQFDTERNRERRTWIHH